MNQRIKDKIEQYKKAAASGKHLASPANGLKHHQGDGLSNVIRSKKDADQFMAELHGVAKRAK